MLRFSDLIHLTEHITAIVHNGSEIVLIKTQTLMAAKISGFTVMDLAHTIHKFDIYDRNTNQSNKMGGITFKILVKYIISTLLTVSVWHTDTCRYSVYVP